MKDKIIYLFVCIEKFLEETDYELIDGFYRNESTLVLNYKDNM